MPPGVILFIFAFSLSMPRLRLFRYLSKTHAHARISNRKSARRLSHVATHLNHVKAFVSSSMPPALALFASPPTTVSVMLATTFLLYHGQTVKSKIVQDTSRELFSSHFYLKYSGPAIFLRSAPPNAILRAVSIAHRPFAPICEVRQLCRSCIKITYESMN